MSRTMSSGAHDRSFFLRASRDIEQVKQHGRRLSTACFNLLVCRIEARNSRVGIVVGKRFGIAVRRNRVKRLFRELSRQVRGELAADYALLVFPKREALTLPFDELKTLWRSTLRRQGVLNTPEQS
jgi:ribonuclease P protein component